MWARVQVDKATGNVGDARRALSIHSILEPYTYFFSLTVNH